MSEQDSADGIEVWEPETMTELRYRLDHIELWGKTAIVLDADYSRQHGPAWTCYVKGRWQGVVRDKSAALALVRQHLEGQHVD
jgi:hypothetical protein